jgi:antitoxin (DNA-binding transcriptional repressor) of toxin-antitoxin stability system
MRQINIHEAETYLGRLVDEAAEGEEIILAKAGKPWIVTDKVSCFSSRMFVAA